MTELYCIDHPLGANDVAYVADCCAGRSSEVENLSCILGKITKVAEEGGRPDQNVAGRMFSKIIIQVWAKMGGKL